MRIRLRRLVVFPFLLVYLYAIMALYMNTQQYLDLNHAHLTGRLKWFDTLGLHNTSTSNSSAAINITTEIDDNVIYTDNVNHLKFGCHNIGEIKVIRSLGHGVTKNGYLGSYKGQNVVLKSVNPTGADVTACMNRKTKPPESCYNFPR